MCMCACNAQTLLAGVYFASLAWLGNPEPALPLRLPSRVEAPESVVTTTFLLVRAGLGCRVVRVQSRLCAMLSTRTCWRTHRFIGLKNCG